MFANLPELESVLDIERANEPSKIAFMQCQSRSEAAELRLASGLETEGDDALLRSADQEMTELPWHLHPDSGCIYCPQTEGELRAYEAALIAVTRNLNDADGRSMSEHDALHQLHDRLACSIDQWRAHPSEEAVAGAVPG